MTISAESSCLGSPRAAATRQAAALPLLRLVLATDQRSVPAVFPMHAMEVPWPYTLDFVY